jgi:hypothetical protein
MKKLLVLFMVLVVLAASVWFCLTSLSPVKRKGTGQIVTNSSHHPVNAAVDRQFPTLEQPTLSPVPSPNTKQVQSPPILPEKTVPAASKLLSESSPPLVVPAHTPTPVSGTNAPLKQPSNDQAAAQNYNNAESANFEPTTLTVVRTFVLTMPDGTPFEQSVSIPVLYRKGSIALKPDQLEALGAIISNIQRILDANEELRVAANLLISKERNVMAGSVPAEVLSARSTSVLPEGAGAPGAKYVNVPQGPVEIAPAPKGP